jgi:hypothetical protein
MEIPFGISIIATVLKIAGHDVDLFVISPVTPVRKILEENLRVKKQNYFIYLQYTPSFHLLKK